MAFSIKMAQAQAHVAFQQDSVDDDDFPAAMDAIYALELARALNREADQVDLDRALALSCYQEELHVLAPWLEEEEPDLTEGKRAPQCTCCRSELADVAQRRTLPCRHLYCMSCISTRCKMAASDRSMVPAHCCKKEYPLDYVKEVLTPAELARYERFLNDQGWQNHDLDSDREYAVTVQQNGWKQCPGCGVGVERTAGCNRMACLNRHEFCYLCGAAWKTCRCSYH